jgi:hypothetical protein
VIECQAYGGPHDGIFFQLENTLEFCYLAVWKGPVDLWNWRTNPEPFKDSTQYWFKGMVPNPESITPSDIAIYTIKRPPDHDGERVTLPTPSTTDYA